MALPDLVLTSTRVVTPQGESPGLVLEGEVQRTFVWGSCVYDSGRFPEQAAGRWIQREGV